jgi:hypothetical protein
VPHCGEAHVRQHLLSPRLRSHHYRPFVNLACNCEQSIRSKAVHHLRKQSVTTASLLLTAIEDFNIGAMHARDTSNNAGMLNISITMSPTFSQMAESEFNWIKMETKTFGSFWSVDCLYPKWIVRMIYWLAFLIDQSRTHRWLGLECPEQYR